MFNWKAKEDITYAAKNAIFLEDGNGQEGRPFKARFLQAGLVKYDFGVCLLKKETIDSFINTFIGCPVIINHKDNLTQSDKAGVIKSIWFSSQDGWFWCEGILTDEKAIELIENGYSISCQYAITKIEVNIEGKLHNANPYDKEILDGVFEHLAIVENPRYEDAFIAVNAYIARNEDEEDIDWVTSKGTHIPIKEGESKDKAVEEFLDEKEATGNIKMPLQKDYENPTNDLNLPQLKNEILKKLNKPSKPILLKKNIIEKNKTHHPEVKIEEYNQILENGLYNPDIIFKTNPNDEYYNFVHYGTDSNSQVLIELAETKDNYEIVNFYKLSDSSLNRKLKKANIKAVNEGGQFLIDIEDETPKVGALSNLENSLIYIINPNRSIFNPSAQNSLTNFIKEHNMSDFLKDLFNGRKEKPMNKEEMKSLMFECLAELKAANEADDKDDKKEEKATNEDKRKLIDEIGGILKGKVDEELWRTIIGKAEKLAYEKSEAGTADNEDDEDKKKGEAKNKAKNKCKNEDGEEKEDKQEEYEEFKEKVREGAENKAKNSFNDAIKKFFEATPSKQKIYMSQKEGIELGKQLY